MVFINPHNAEDDPPTIEFSPIIASMLYQTELSIIYPVVSIKSGTTNTLEGYPHTKEL